MPIFAEDFTIPADTQNWQDELKLPVPSIREVAIFFPPGCMNTVGVKVGDNNAIFAPAPPTTGYLKGEGITVAWPESKIMSGPPYRVTFEGYNNGRYDHTISVRIVAEAGRS